MNDEGLWLNAAVIVDTGEIKKYYHAAALIGFGAQAVCPYLALDIARNIPIDLLELDADSKEKNILNALEHGLLKVMAKMGISVVRSYQSAKLFSALGLGNEVIQEFFPGIQSPIGGLEQNKLCKWFLIELKKYQKKALSLTNQLKASSIKNMLAENL